MIEERLGDRLSVRAAVPDTLEDAFAPLAWFVERAGDGIELTERGHVSRAFVREACERWQWWSDRPGEPQREDDVPQIGTVRGLAASLRLAGKRKRTLFARRPNAASSLSVSCTG
jgi:hypothetical protein